MRILHVSSTSTLSGANRYCFDLAAGQKDLGHEPVVSMPAAPGLAFDFARADIATAPLKGGRAFSFLRAVMRIRPDIIHCHDGTTTRWMRFMFRRPPTLATLHIHYKPSAMSHLDAVHALADWQLPRLAGFKGVVRKINNWAPAISLPTPDSIARARQAAGADPSDFLAAFVGRIEHVKGIDVLLAALARITAPSFRLAIVGAGNNEAEIRAAAARDPRVTFIGYTSTPSDWYGAADLIVMPSRYEPFALVALESMAARTPVVATTVGGFPEIFANSAVDLVPPEDAASLADAINRRISAKTVPGIARLDYDLARFDRATGVAAITDFYQDVIAAKRSGA
jgi:glycosyltransferase involved in cell wall biosynthesis